MKSIECRGSAHANAEVDNCGVCLGSPCGWGRLPAPRTPRPRNLALAAVKAAIKESIETDRTVTVRASDVYRVPPGADACYERLERLVGALVLVADEHDTARIAPDEYDAWGVLDGEEWRLRLLAYE